MIAQLLDKSGFSRLSLATQLAGSIFLVLLVSVIIAVGFMRANLQAALVDEVNQQSKNMLATLSSSLLDDLITEDIPKLESVVSRIARFNESIIYVRIENEESQRLLEFGMGFAGKTNLLKYTHQVELEGEVFGRIVIVIDLSARYNSIDNQVFDALIKMAVSLVLLAAFILLLIHWLVIVPLKSINSQINSLSDGNLDLEAVLKSSSDIAGLADSVSAHANSLREQEVYKQQLHDEKIRVEKASQAKSDFLSSMSHELRTPLNAILGFSQLLRLDTTLDVDERESVIEIEKAGDHLLKLVNQVLDLAKVESGKLEVMMQQVSVSELLAEAVRLVSTLAQQNHIELQSDIQAGVMVTADRLRLKQIVLNLLSNAIKYNSVNGHVYIKLAEHSNATSISIRDEGAGIAGDELDKLFEPFNRLAVSDASIEGAGIGLSISKRLVELMDAEILVESVVGRGSTFTIVFHTGSGPA